MAIVIILFLLVYTTWELWRTDPFFRLERVLGKPGAQLASLIMNIIRGIKSLIIFEFCNNPDPYSSRINWQKGRNEPCIPLSEAIVRVEHSFGRKIYFYSHNRADIGGKVILRFGLFFEPALKFEMQNENELYDTGIIGNPPFCTFIWPKNTYIYLNSTFLKIGETLIYPGFFRNRFFHDLQNPQSQRVTGNLVNINPCPGCTFNCNALPNCTGLFYSHYGCSGGCCGGYGLRMRVWADLLFHVVLPANMTLPTRVFTYGSSNTTYLDVEKNTLVRLFTGEEVRINHYKPFDVDDPLFDLDSLYAEAIPLSGIVEYKSDGRMMLDIAGYGETGSSILIAINIFDDAYALRDTIIENQTLDKMGRFNLQWSTNERFKKEKLHIKIQYFRDFFPVTNS